MAKKNKAKKANKARTAPVRAVVMRNKVLDQQALQYANLLMDPCSQRLVPPVYPGADAGFLFRAESFATFGGGATETAGIVHWVPGYVNFSNTELLASAGPTGATTITMATNGAGPGRTFLAANAKGNRCIAACLKVTFPGAESTRAGRVHYGITQAGMLDNGTAATVDGVAQTLQHYSRTPTDTIEIVWRPNVADTEFNDPTEVASSVLRDRKSALTVAWAGIPGSTGMTMHFTAVYEWTPAPSLGVASNATGKNTTANTLDDVLDYIVSRGFTYVRNSAYMAMPAITQGLVGAAQRYFGLMPSGQRSRMYSIAR